MGHLAVPQKSEICGYNIKCFAILPFIRLFYHSSFSDNRRDVLRRGNIKRGIVNINAIRRYLPALSFSKGLVPVLSESKGDLSYKPNLIR